MQKSCFEKMPIMQHNDVASLESSRTVIVCAPAPRISIREHRFFCKKIAERIAEHVLELWARGAWDDHPCSDTPSAHQHNLDGQVIKQIQHDTFAFERGIYTRVCSILFPYLSSAFTSEPRNL